MKTGLWTLRRQGETLARLLPGDIVRPAGNISNREAFRDAFASYDAWILVMATGIAVRYLQGLPDSKYTDPAVVVLDEAARFAVPLLGGHERGGNALAYQVAEITGAIPVITTATEALKPLVVGIGCRRGVSAKQIGAAVTAALPAGRTLNEIREVATVDLKVDEPGLRSWLVSHDIPLRIIGTEQIRQRPWAGRPSDWVQRNIGLPGVCEPAALIACHRGSLIVPKTGYDGVAIAIVEDFGASSDQAPGVALTEPGAP